MTVNIDLFDDLDAVAAAAGGALGRAAQPCLFHRLDWFRLVAAHCPPPGRLLAMRGSKGGESAWLFLAVDGREARPWGAWYSLRFDAIGSRDPDVMTALAAALRDGGLAEIELAPLADPEPLLAGLRAAGWVAAAEPKTANWRIDTSGMDFAAYWAGRPGKLRSTAKRRAKAAGLEVAVHDRFDPSAWADYEAVYRASWKPEEGSFPFLRALAEQEGAAGTLRLGVAKKEGRPIAAQLWTVEGGEAIIHKLAYAEDSKALSPGTILSEAMFRHALDEDRVSAIDYGTGDEAYKADWMAQRRTLWRLTAHNPRTFAGLFGAAKARVGAWRRRRAVSTPSGDHSRSFSPGSGSV